MNLPPKVSRVIGNLLSPFLIKDLISICISYCQWKDHLIRKWEIKERKESEFFRAFAVSKDHEIYAINHLNGKVKVFTSEGSLIREWKISDEGAYGYEIAIGESEVDNFKIYIINPKDGYIQVFTLEGLLLEKWKNLDIYPYAALRMSIRRFSEIYISRASNHSIQVFSLHTGKFLREFRHEEGHFLGIAISSRDEIYLLDHDGNCVLVLNPEGKLLRKWGNIPIKIPRGSREYPEDRLDKPKEIAILSYEDNYEEIYVINDGDDCVRIFDQKGKFLRKIDRFFSGNLRNIGITPMELFILWIASLCTYLPSNYENISLL